MTMRLRVKTKICTSRLCPSQWAREEWLARGEWLIFQERESLTGFQIRGLWLYCRKNLLRRLDQERMSTKCMEGWGHGIKPFVKHRCACTFPPFPLLTLSVLMLHAGQQYQLGQQLGLSCHHPIDGYHPSPFPRLAGAGHRSSLGVTHNSLA